MLLPVNECNQIRCMYSTELDAYLVASWGVLAKSSRNNLSVYRCQWEGVVSLEKGSSCDKTRRQKQVFNSLGLILSLLLCHIIGEVLWWLPREASSTAAGGTKMLSYTLSNINLGQDPGHSSPHVAPFYPSTIFLHKK